jgi:hypothetical protein
VGRLTHAQSRDGAVGFAVVICRACALHLPRCSSGGRCGREEREESNLFSPPPSATRRRCPARGPPRRSCRWCACSLPCHYGKASRFVRVPEKKRKTIPVLTPRARYANRLSRYIRFHTSAAQLLAMSGSPTEWTRGPSCVLGKRKVKRRPAARREATFTMTNTYSVLPPVVSSSILRRRRWRLTSI